MADFAERWKGVSVGKWRRDSVRVRADRARDHSETLFVPIWRAFIGKHLRLQTILIAASSLNGMASGHIIRKPWKGIPTNMSEFRNYIVLKDCPIGKVLDVLRSELVGKRKWQEVASEAPGAKFIEVWRATPNMTVVELPSNIESDPALGQALSRDCETSVAAHYYESHSGVRELHIFERGKKLPARMSPFADLADRDAWDQLRPDSAVQTLSLRDGNSERVAEAMGLIGVYFEPVLRGLKMIPTKIRADHPAIEFAIGYALVLADGTKVVVRYSVPMEGALTIAQDIWRQDAASKQYAQLWPGDKTRFIADCDATARPALLMRECQLLAARFVRQGAALLEESVPAMKPIIEGARKSELWQRTGAALEDLQRRRNVAMDRGPGWQSASIVFKGAQLLRVQAEAIPQRFTFRCSTSDLPDSKEVAVGGLWESWVGTVGARMLRIANSVLTFDYDGEYIGRSDHEP